MLKLIRLGSLTLAAALAGFLAYATLNGGVRETITSTVSIGAPFRLASSKGGFVDSADLSGKPYAVFFGFTHCPEVCPTTMYEMSKALGKLGTEAKDLRVFFITVDPERDTPQFLADYVVNFDPRIEGLVPTLEELPALARAFRVIYEKVPTSDGAYTMNHTATLFLMGRDGKFFGTIAYGEAEEMRMAKLERLLKDG